MCGNQFCRKGDGRGCIGGAGTGTWHQPRGRPFATMPWQMWRDIGLGIGASKDAKKGPQGHSMGMRNGAGDEGHLDSHAHGGDANPDPFPSSTGGQRLRHMRVRGGLRPGTHAPELTRKDPKT